MPSEVVVASNRGPLSFRLDDEGALSCSRGGGGLVSGLSTALADGHGTWVCAAMSEGDRKAVEVAGGGRLGEAGFDTGGIEVRMLALDPVLFHRAYNGIANGTLWFLTHHLFDTARQPLLDRAWHREWDAYVAYNEHFADAMAQEAAPGARVVVQDYHLFLAPTMLRARRPDLRIGHFTHTPWADPGYFAMLPREIGSALVTGLLGCDDAAFHTERWADAFLGCAEQALPDAEVDRVARTIRHDGTVTHVSAHPLGVDGAELLARASERDVAVAASRLREWAGGRQVVLRVDRTELSKNIVRGLHAYRELLRTYPEHRGRVVQLAFAYPSRHDLPEYRAYTGEVQALAAEINDEFDEPGWQPVRLEVSDDYPRSLAALAMADVLVVNPVRDGMNLVAKEGAVLSREGLALVLSTEAGAVPELGEHALCVSPFDVTGTAEAIHSGLVMDPAERRRRTDALAAAATRNAPGRWFADQLAALA